MLGIGVFANLEAAGSSAVALSGWCTARFLPMLVTVACLGAGCSGQGGVPAPTDRRPENVTIGDTTLTVETALCQGRVVPPAAYPVALDTITVWSGFGGTVPVGRDGRFHIRMNTDATGLVVARDAAGATLFLTVFPASPDLLDRELVLDADSTARAMVFTQPFVSMGKPDYDALVLDAIGALPETASLASTLATQLAANPHALGEGDATVAAALGAAADALAAAADAAEASGTGSTTAPLIDTPADSSSAAPPEAGGRRKDGETEADISNLWFSDTDGVNADRVQFLDFTPNADRSSAAVWEQNWRARWVFFHLDRPGDPTDRPFAALAALAPPRKFELPGLGSLLGEVASRFGQRLFREGFWRTLLSAGAVDREIAARLAEDFGPREMHLALRLTGIQQGTLRGYTLGMGDGTNPNRDVPPGLVSSLSALVLPAISLLTDVAFDDLSTAAGVGRDVAEDNPVVCIARVAVASARFTPLTEFFARLSEIGDEPLAFWNATRDAVREVRAFLADPEIRRAIDEEGCVAWSDLLDRASGIGSDTFLGWIGGAGISLLDAATDLFNYGVKAGAWLQALLGEAAYDDYRVTACAAPCIDRDADGAFDPAASGCQCTPADCDDTWAAVNPGHAETCNGRDDDCDGSTDEGLTRPCATVCGGGIETCIGGTYRGCSARSPTTEACDGLDNDCDGAVDEGCACVGGRTQSCYSGPPATLGMAACLGGTQTCTGGAWGTCVGEVLPQPEVCDGDDNDCTGIADDHGVCGAPVTEAPLSGVVPEVFSYAGGTFRINVSPLDPDGNLITGGVTPGDFFFSPIDVQNYSSGALVAGASATVDSIEIVPPAGSGGIHAVIAMDSSGSMTGSDPVRLRVDAARQFIARLGPADVAAVIDFGAGATGDIRLLADFTSDQATLNAAVGLVVADDNTPLYDALIYACDILAGTYFTSGFVLVLSDGADTSSTNTVDAAVARCAGMTVPLFTVGLGGLTSVAILQDLAARTGGAYAEAADAFALATLFDGIGAGMTRGRVVVHGIGTFDPPLTSAGRFLISGSLFTSLGGATAQTPFSFSVEVM